MRNKILPVLLLFLSILSSCKQSSNKLIIKGKLDTNKETYVYLQELTADNNGKKDSVLLTSSGKFKFEKELTYPSFFRIWTGLNTKQLTLATHPGERIKIGGRADDLSKTYSIEGSDDSKLAMELVKKLNKTISKSDSLNKLYISYANNPNIVNIRRVLTNSYNEIIEEQRNFNISFIEKNKNSITSILALYQQVSQNTWIFYKEEDLKYFEEVDLALYKKYPNAPYVNMLHGNVQEMKQQQQKVQMQKMLSAMGSKAPEIVLPSLRGDSVRLSSLKGKCVLVHFWASWNTNSRNENIELKALYRKYKLKGFEIYQVSLDKSKDAWIKAVRADETWWAQGCDLKFWDSPAVLAYNVTNIPTSFLIDKDGVIIGRDLKGVSLENKIQEIVDITSNTTSK
jgi:peroxiredoxin